jgi:hypothetical protein
MDDKTAQRLRGIAKRYAAIGRQIQAGASPHDTNRRATEMAAEMLDALGGYLNAAHFLTFIQGPVQHYFIQRYEAEIQADADRQTLERYDNPDTRREAVGRALMTGRIIELDEDQTHWQFRYAVSDLELIQWAHRQGVAPGSDPGALRLANLRGLKAAVVAEALHGHLVEEEEVHGQYL